MIITGIITIPGLYRRQYRQEALKISRKKENDSVNLSEKGKDQFLRCNKK